MKVYKGITIAAIVLMVANCSIRRATVERNILLNEGDRETIYYRNYMEAYRKALVKNYKGALEGYGVCMRLYPDRSAPYYQVSNVYLQVKSLDRAEYYGKKAVKLDSSNIWYKINLASLYQYQSKYDSAAMVYKDVVRMSQNPQYIYNLALLYAQSGQEENALGELDSLSGDIANSEQVLMTKHNIFNSLKEYDSAIAVLQSIIKLFPDNINNYGILAEYLSEVGRDNYARQVYKKTITMDSTNGLALLSFGDFYLKNDEIDSGFYYYTKAFCCSDLQLDNKLGVVINFLSDKKMLDENYPMIIKLLDTIPRFDTDYRVYAAYADVYMNVEKYDSARVYFRRTLDLEKTNFIIWQQAMVVNNMLNDYRGVLNLADECKIYFPKEPNVFLFSAFAYRSLGINDSAIMNIDTCMTFNLKKDPKIQALNLLADIYHDEGQFDRSDSCYEEVLTIEPENLMVRNNYSYYLSLRSKNLNKAQELSKLTIEKDPKNATYLDTYGWILFKMGKVKEARDYISDAIRNGAFNNAEVLDHYGEIMKALGKCQDAIEAWQKAVEVDSTYNVQPKLNELENSCK